MKLTVCLVLSNCELIILLFMFPVWATAIYFGNFPPNVMALLWAGIWIFTCVGLAKIPARLLDKNNTSTAVGVGLLSLSLLRMTLILAGFIVLREFIEEGLQKPVILIGVSFFFFTILLDGFLKLFFQSLK